MTLIEICVHLITCNPGHIKIMVSLDVESLFTNVPIEGATQTTLRKPLMSRITSN